MSTNNILLINKPKHWTSNDVIRYIKKNLNVKKCGHAGTLDPLATGLLLIGINNGTKQLANLICEDKTYIATIHFNYYTNTLDSEGDIIDYKYDTINIKNIINSLDYFKNNNYYQTPPKFSAIKIKGKKAYELARNNIEFDLIPKLVKLYDYKIISYIDHELNVELKVSKGFYIRSFCYDLGKKLNNFGNLANLIRTQIGEYKLSEAHNIKDIKIDDNKN